MWTRRARARSFRDDTVGPNQSSSGEGERVSRDPDATTPVSTPSSSLHGRFEPGTRLGKRYRIVGLLGRGGMGEVYRADDLELNQSVAIKLLPERVGRNPDDLARLRSEVRTARQIAHPNVCRTYDIAETDGLVFVIMEYVDGEDLASVLRRLGRPTSDKAVEIARGICLGLGAAHESGVIHRDLKPSNIMIDGRGRVRIMDFGIAGTVEEFAGERGIAGTPEYMSPEQRRGAPATVQSDIYSLGLVLFEVFTGKRASEVKATPDPQRPGTQARRPSSVVHDIDPAVERVVLRCLQVEPALRPQSAYAAYGALPGSDPLAAAVAAGETPSPDLVANAGGQGTLKPLWAALCVVTLLAGALGRSVLDGPTYAGLTKSPPAQSARAEEILTHLTGVNAPRFSAQSFRYGPSDPSHVQAMRPAQYWRRWSPDMLTPGFFGTVALDDPPQVYAGSGQVVLDPQGKLLALSIVPDRTRDSSRTRPGSPDWDFVIRSAGREPGMAVPAAPPSSFRVESDSIAAWKWGGATNETTLVAASVEGRITSVDTYVKGRPLGDLTTSSPPESTKPFEWILATIFYVLPCVGAILLARRNMRRDRVDSRGARILFLFMVVLGLVAWLVKQDISELGPLLIVRDIMAGPALGRALIAAVTLTLAYLAIEPFVRRLWPHALVSWVRLSSGKFRDPIVGRDILVGGALGVAWAFMADLNHALDSTFGLRPHSTQVMPLTGILGRSPLFGASSVLSFATNLLGGALTMVAIFFTIMVVLRAVLRKNWLALSVLAVMFSFLANSLELSPGSLLIFLMTSLILNAVIVLVAVRYGLVATLVAAFSSSLLEGLPWTTNLGSWLGGQVMLQWVIVLAVCVFAFVTATRGQLALGDILSEPDGVRGKARPAER